MEVARTVVRDVLDAIVRPLLPSLLTAFLLSVAYLHCIDASGAGQGWRHALSDWWGRVRTSSFFRRLCLLCLCVAMILFRTVLGRGLWHDPLAHTAGGWLVLMAATGSGTVYQAAECIENILLMAPFTFLLLWTFGRGAVGARSGGAGAVLWGAAKVSFLFSLGIEVCQLALRLGEFQLSDLVHNTLGGVLGALLWLARAGRGDGPRG